MPTRSLVCAAVAVAVLTCACRSTMSIDEARRVTADLAAGPSAPPPRTVSDITAILEQERRADPELARARTLVDQPPPTTTDPNKLAEFYYRRGLAARELGRAAQEFDDLTRASELAPRMDILNNLSNSHFYAGNLSRARAIRERMLGMRGPGLTGWQITNHATLARLYAISGDLEAAEAAAREAQRLLRESRNWSGTPPEVLANWESSVATAHASVAEVRGRYAEAERFYREAIEALTSNAKLARDPLAYLQTARLSLVLVRQGRLLEAESEARRALLAALERRGRNSKDTATMLRILTRAIVEQGRYVEAEALARASLDIYAQIGVPPESYTMALAHTELAAAFVGQGRWEAAAAEFESVRRQLAEDRETFDKSLALVGFRENAAIALLKTGRTDRAVDLLGRLLERHRHMYGDAHPNTAETRGLLGAAHAARGEVRPALDEFASATRVLLDRTTETDDDLTTAPARDQRLRLILASYVSLLARIRGTADERMAGLDAAAEAFRLAEAARGAAVQRSLDAAAARAAARTPALADLVRREQDARRQIGALEALVAAALATPDGHGGSSAQTLRAQIDVLRQARRAIRQQIERDFPAYTELINPRPLTLTQVQSQLRPGEALVTTYVVDDETFVWAVPHAGPVAFVAAPIGRRAVEEMTTRIRRSLDSGAASLGSLPRFDVALAHRLYTTLLEPVAEGWRRADTLLVVAHGPLGQLPVGLLPTRPVPLEAGRLPFAEYRQVPWLIRSHAVTVLPSVTALATLRAFPPGAPDRRPFIGFGDPLFSAEQALEAAREAAPAAAVTAASDEQRLTMRASPRSEGLDSSRLAMLPRLPDTADEVRGIALALDADLTRDVLLGARANERSVKTLRLAGYRVVAFATHGLVAGDLDGLTQPALALSAPDVADVDGDGLLTMDEILALRLDADWIVLSACNTASARDAGADTLSGLGRAFFYAGARALLVSNWPVETTSARELTTDLFRRQREHPELTRARALQATINALIDGPGFVDQRTNSPLFSYAHPIFWAPFTLVGDGGN